MPRYVALLRGVSPMNCSMPELRACFETAGYGTVRTVLATGNVAFDTRDVSIPELELELEEAMFAGMGYSFPTIVRSSASLQRLVASAPFARFGLASSFKPVVTFVRTPLPEAGSRALALPIERDGARILACVGGDVLTAYQPGPNGPAFMTLLERTFGKEITTRTLGTVEKCAAA